ncbi:MAG: glycosyltransferase, partial [Solirubrobacterales bacterium]|nr:glycosyltransferase [Solirubrobacterales bacterium]
PSNVIIDRFIPQMHVLPKASAVISHGGSGTVLAALSLGLPQLCLPFFADQPLNARAVADAGAGLVLDLSSTNAVMITEALARLLTDQSFRQSAQQIAKEIREMPAPAEVASALTRLG